MAASEDVSDRTERRKLPHGLGTAVGLSSFALVLSSGEPWQITASAGLLAVCVVAEGYRWWKRPV